MAMESRSNAEGMEPRSIADAMEDRSNTEQQSGATAACTSFGNKCRGKYRIKVKGAACHGRACCMGI